MCGVRQSSFKRSRRFGYRALALGERRLGLNLRAQARSDLPDLILDCDRPATLNDGPRACAGRFGLGRKIPRFASKLSLHDSWSAAVGNLRLGSRARMTLALHRALRDQTTAHSAIARLTKNGWGRVLDQTIVLSELVKAGVDILPSAR